MQRPNVEKPDIDEHGAKGQSSDSRLFMQFMCFGGCRDTSAVVQAVKMAGVQAVVYEDIHTPYGIAIVTIAENPDDFLGPVRAMFQSKPFTSLSPRPDLSMLGRTYSLGYEHDLRDTLFDRPRRTALNPDWSWAIWYPLRRSGKFAQLNRDEQMDILKEHGTIGMGFGQADYAHDIRLACHGLDKNDNDFVVGLVGKELLPLSKIVQTMRGTKQTSLYLERLGPFFVGKVVWQAEV
jgi:chlorite dismutase